MDVEEIKSMVLQGLTHKNISETLKMPYPLMKGLSVRNVRRFRSRHNIHKPKANELDKIIRDSVTEV